jgi:uncharacterized protein YegP (UPF0339 family)
LGLVEQTADSLAVSRFNAHPPRETLMPAKFVLTKSNSGSYHFHLLATNGKVIASSEPYESRTAALRGIESIRKNAAGARLVEQD